MSDCASQQQSCYYCGEVCDNLFGNPGSWGIPLCHDDQPGVVKYHHIACVSQRLEELERLRAEQLPRSKTEILDRLEKVLRSRVDGKIVEAYRDMHIQVLRWVLGEEPKP